MIKRLTEVWYIIGDEQHLFFGTKMDAEIYARELFPGQHPERRYARIMFKTVHYCAPNDKASTAPA